jgi:hypothetical protein
LRLGYGIGVGFGFGIGVAIAIAIAIEVAVAAFIPAVCPADDHARLLGDSCSCLERQIPEPARKEEEEPRNTRKTRKGRMHNRVWGSVMVP